MDSKETVHVYHKLDVRDGNGGWHWGSLARMSSFSLAPRSTLPCSSTNQALDSQILNFLPLLDSR